MDEVYKEIPEHMMRGLKLYVEEGCPMGSFLTAVASDQLFKALSRADSTNKAIVHVYCQWFHWEAPDGCHGSPEIVTAWILKKERERNAKDDS